MTIDTFPLSEVCWGGAGEAGAAAVLYAVLFAVLFVRGVRGGSAVGNTTVSKSEHEKGRYHTVGSVRH